MGDAGLPVCPTNRPTSSRVEFQIRNTPFTTSHLLCNCISCSALVKLKNGFDITAMASDALVPETRVLAIASHVRVTHALHRVSNECNR